MLENHPPFYRTNLLVSFPYSFSFYSEQDNMNMFSLWVIVEINFPLIILEITCKLVMEYGCRLHKFVGKIHYFFFLNYFYNHRSYFGITPL